MFNKRFECGRKKIKKKLLVLVLEYYPREIAMIFWSVEIWNMNDDWLTGERIRMRTKKNQRNINNK